MVQVAEDRVSEIATAEPLPIQSERTAQALTDSPVALVKSKVTRSGSSQTSAKAIAAMACDANRV